MIIFRSIALYLAIGGIILGVMLMRNIAAPQPQQQPVAEPAVNPYSNAIVASGIIESADRNVAIGVPQPGIVTVILADVWNSVNKGDPLFQIDDRDLRAQLVVQQANIAVAEATVNRFQDQLNRLESVSDPRAVSKEEVRTRQHDVAVAIAQLASAKAQANQTEQLIDRLTVRAPKEGVVLQNNIRLGEYVSSSTAIPAMLLGHLDNLQVRVDIDEQNACRIQPNQTAVAFLKNNTSRPIPLHFERIEPYVVPKKSLTGSSEEKVDTRVLQVIYSFSKPKDLNLYVGQQADIFIQDKES